MQGNGLVRALRGQQALRESRMFAALPDLRIAHYVDVIVRMNGQDKRYEADWIKQLQRVVLAEGEGK